MKNIVASVLLTAFVAAAAQAAPLPQRLNCAPVKCLAGSNCNLKYHNPTVFTALDTPAPAATAAGKDLGPGKALASYAGHLIVDYTLDPAQEMRYYQFKTADLAALTQDPQASITGTFYNGYDAVNGGPQVIAFVLLRCSR